LQLLISYIIESKKLLSIIGWTAQKTAPFMRSKYVLLITYIINSQYVIALGKKFVQLDGGTELVISRAMKKRFNEELSACYSEYWKEKS
jgi:hypothetical protein